MGKHRDLVAPTTQAVSANHTLARPHFLVPHSTANPTNEQVEPSVVFVDLDGTLVATDLLAEALLRIVSRRPAILPQCIVAAFQGRASLKQCAAESVHFDAKLLPYRPEVIDLLRQQKAKGNTIVLATASPVEWANAVAKHLGLFDAVLASDGNTNLKGPAKLRAITAYCRQVGQQEFAYVGDSVADLPIWQQAARVYVVAPSASLGAKLAQQGARTQPLVHRTKIWMNVLKLLRPHQWTKNLLLFVPICLAHMVDVQGMASALLAFLVFSLAASSVYVLNDLVDIDSDRQHPTKRNRPFASGALSVAYGPPLALMMLTAAVTIAAITLPLSFFGFLVLYLAVTTLYSFWLKRIVVVDVMVLAGLYTLRIIAGTVATASPMSEWLLGLSLFLFTSLAFAKRYAELSRLAGQNQSDSVGRGYLVTDLSVIESLGPASGYLAVLVLALYVNSDAMRSLYSTTWPLWLICPLFMYWITRVWFFAKRGQLSEDPVVFALKDRTSRVLAASVVLLAFLASSGH